MLDRTASIVASDIVKPRGKPSPWTDDDEANLRRWWDEGLTGREISVGFGGRFTRNAVIGKVHRLGLDNRGTPILTTEQKLERERARTRQKMLRQKTRRREEKGLPPLTIPETPEPAEFLGLTFGELQRRQCHYPRGEGAEMRFCGQRVIKGQSYCTHCYRITHHIGPRHPLPSSNREAQDSFVLNRGGGGLG